MNRRGFLGGLLAMPAIIRTPGLLMPVRPMRAAGLYYWEFSPIPGPLLPVPSGICFRRQL